ncbi:MAG TPA: hypothetical protein RMG95_10285, partial [Polyangiaceae bacterium LLY-WYZ-15_(1-7)]|nr:hypothetical protein [Polyangiaceae bacterium LLY-WYZ-15_(1-7)]
DGAAGSGAARPAEAPANLAARRRRRRALVAFGGALAAAAIALLVLFPRGAALPGYQLERLGGDASTRSSADAPARYGPTDRLEIRLRPETRVDAPVHAAAFVDGRRWDAPLEVSATGAVRVVGPAGELLPDLGEHTIVFVLDEAPAPTLERHARRLELVLERIP